MAQETNDLLGKKHINTDMGSIPGKESQDLRLFDIAPFIRTVKKNFVAIAVIGLVCGFLTGLYSFTKPNLFTSGSIVLPEISSSSRSGGLSDVRALAGMVGVDLGVSGSGADAIRPDLYPEVLKTVDFAEFLLRQKVFTQKDTTRITLEAFLRKKPETRLNFSFGKRAKKKEAEEFNPDPFRKSPVPFIDRDKAEMINYIVNGLVVSVYDKKTGMTSVAVQATDPVVAGIVNRLSLDYLKEYMTEYRTQKTKDRVRLLTERLEQAEGRYQNKQVALQSHRDRNLNPFLNMGRIQEERLESDFRLAQTTYNQLALELELTRLRLNEEAPVFKELVSPVIPYRKSGPQRSRMVLMGGILGCVISLGLFYLKAEILPRWK